MDALIRPERYPRSSGYDPSWLRDLDIGPHPLWQPPRHFDTVVMGANTHRPALQAGLTSAYPHLDHP